MLVKKNSLREWTKNFADYGETKRKTHIAHKAIRTERFTPFNTLKCCAAAQNREEELFIETPTFLYRNLVSDLGKSDGSKIKTQFDVN